MVISKKRKKRSLNWKMLHTPLLYPVREMNTSLVHFEIEYSKEPFVQYSAHQNYYPIRKSHSSKKNKAIYAIILKLQQSRLSLSF